MLLMAPLLIINWCGHHTTFTLVFLLFYNIIPISFIQLTSICVSPSRFEKTRKKDKIAKYQNPSSIKRCAAGSSILGKILWYSFSSSLSFKCQSSATCRRGEMYYYNIYFATLLIYTLVLYFNQIKIYTRLSTYNTILKNNR